jgi:NMD protein affecting ribosome stability and mRNA decay
MRCHSCNSPDGKWVESWEDYYCDECLDAIYESLEVFDEEEEFLKEMFCDD